MYVYENNVQVSKGRPAHAEEERAEEALGSFFFLLFLLLIGSFARGWPDQRIHVVEALHSLLLLLLLFLLRRQGLSQEVPKSRVVDVSIIDDMKRRQQRRASRAPSGRPAALLPSASSVPLELSSYFFDLRRSVVESFAQGHPHRQPLVGGATDGDGALQRRIQRVRHGFPKRPLEVLGLLKCDTAVTLRNGLVVVVVVVVAVGCWLLAVGCKLQIEWLITLEEQLLLEELTLAIFFRRLSSV